MSEETVVKRAKCPGCERVGADTTGDNLIHYSDGGQHCFACGYHVSGTGSSAEYASPTLRRGADPEFTIPDGTPLALGRRGISKETAARYRVRIADTGDVYFPLFDESGVMVASKYRPLEGGDLSPHPPKYRWAPRSNSDAMMFGMHLFNPKLPTILCTGETDTLACAEAMGTKYNVVGATKGEGGWADQLTAHADVLSRCKKFIVVFDNDVAGSNARAGVLAALLKRAEVSTVVPPLGVKDAGEMLVKGTLAKAIRNAKPVVAEGIKSRQARIKDAIKFYTDKSNRVGRSTGLSGFDYLSGGYVPGKLIVGAADTGIGKTRFLQYLSYLAASDGTPVLFIPLEMTTTQVDLQMVEIDLERQLLGCPDDSCPISKDELTASLERVTENLYQADHFGSLSVQELERRVTAAVTQYGIKLVVLDHLTAMCTGPGGIDWQALDGIMARIKQLAIDNQVTVLTVSHVNTPKDGSTTEHEGQDVRIVSLHEMRGGRSIEHYSDCVFGMSRVYGLNVVWVYTLKQDRFAGRHVSPLRLGYKWTHYTFNEFVTDEASQALRRAHEAKANTKEEGLPRRVRQQAGVRPTPQASEDEAPSADIPMARDGTPEVHTRLHTTERDTDRGEGDVVGRRQGQATEVQEAAPRRRPTTSTAATFLKAARKQTNNG